MSRSYYMNHLVHLKEEVKELQSRVKPSATGHILTAIGVLEERIKETEKVLGLVSAHKLKFKKVVKSITKILPETGVLMADELGEAIFLLLEGANVQGSTEKSPIPMKKAKQIIEKLV